MPLDDPEDPAVQDDNEDQPRHGMSDVVVYGAGMFNPWDLAAGRPDKKRRPRPASAW